MARYANNPSVESLPSGKIKGTGYQVRRHYGQAYLMRAPGPRISFSSAEKEAQQRFAEATRLASLDMKNPQAKAYWNAHKKQYKRAYDAAKAHYLRLLNTPIPPKKQSKPLPKPTNQYAKWSKCVNTNVLITLFSQSYLQIPRCKNNIHLSVKNKILHIKQIVNDSKSISSSSHYT